MRVFNVNKCFFTAFNKCILMRFVSETFHTKLFHCCFLSGYGLGRASPMVFSAYSIKAVGIHKKYNLKF